MPRVDPAAQAPGEQSCVDPMLERELLCVPGVAVRASHARLYPRRDLTTTTLLRRAYKLAPHLQQHERIRQIPNMKDCPTCRGNGTVKCDYCNGTGCSKCKQGANKCSVCEGAGAIQTD
ncbi:hypothetical protein T440DRAFT_475499 [Plenodomus tracheiphilus IPT5]|uniref:Uncharacterized protein n=1 Tax=Plenodomus tracheiphilus IPT5 TaxID=1408161 RepID=A0A6A7BLA2_9PLEO|nr:hypothetical protein T440DRAFT_475499 [Plenodomus tracheiphilus IPT5]